MAESEKHWFAVYTKPQKEEYAELNLRLRGIDTFFPKLYGGPFDGLVGIIKEPPNARGRVKVLLQLLNRETNVDVPVQFISATWVTQAQPARP